MNNKILLIDGNSILFKAYFATTYTSYGNSKNSSGISTNATQTFAKMIRLAINKIEPTHLLIAFDKSSKTQRKEKYENYKATRHKTPEALLIQMPIVRELLTLQGIFWYETTKWEADDIIATIAKKESNHNSEILIISSDYDLFQLVDKNIKYMLSKQGMSNLIEYNNVNFFEKVGIYPSQIPDYKGLVGDPSDNLPGVKGIGTKGAIKLLNEYKTLKNIYNSIEQLPQRTQKLLLNSKSNAFLTLELAKLNKNLNIPFKLNDYVLKQRITSELIKFCEKYSLNAFLRSINKKSKSKYERIIF